MTERELRTAPAYDYRGQTPDYGQHPMELFFLIRGEKGVLVFSINTGWYLDRSQPPVTCPQYATLSFHAQVLDPHFSEVDLHENCSWLNGAPCLATNPYGFSGARINQLRDGFVAKGLEWLWLELEEEYRKCEEGQ